MCGDNEPHSGTSIYCPYPDVEHGTWTVQTEFINSKPGVAVYVGTSILEINGSHICQKQFVMIVTLNSNSLSQINISTTVSWVLCSIRRLPASTMRCSKAPYMMIIFMRPIQLVANCSSACRQRMSAYMGIVSTYVHRSWSYYYICLYPLISYNTII